MLFPLANPLYTNLRRPSRSTSSSSTNSSVSLQERLFPMIHNISQHILLCLRLPRRHHSSLTASSHPSGFASTPPSYQVSLFSSFAYSSLRLSRLVHPLILLTQTKSVRGRMRNGVRTPISQLRLPCERRVQMSAVSNLQLSSWRQGVCLVRLCAGI